jgi:hypothetical protein
MYSRGIKEKAQALLGMDRKIVFNLILISFLTLFGELVFIRYLSSNIYLLSFYKNSVLLAVFLGLGTGFMLSKEKRNFVEYLPLAALVLLCLIIYFNDYLRIDLDYSAKDETIWPEFWANTRATGVPIFGVLVFFYIVVALFFVPFGQETVRAMRSFKPLTAYSLNIGGSLLGILAFSVCGWLWTKPILWFMVLLVPLLWWTYAYSTRTIFYVNIAAVTVSLFLVFSAQFGPELWSPYSKVRVYMFSESPEYGFISTTNGNPQVGSMNFDIEYSGPEKGLNEESRSIYEIPYRIIKPSSVIVAGAGAGNEVAMALRYGADEVTAVELDPVFIALGRVLSPHRPFMDPRVRVEVNDARAFFHETREKYDLVVIGFLDSQYHLSHLTNIRTENFVYTYESIRRTKELLTPGGILQLNYNAPKSEMRERLFAILLKVYGPELVVFAPSKPVSGNISFLAGPGVRGLVSGVGEGAGGEAIEAVRKIEEELPALRVASFGSPDIETDEEYPTDNWPFLYLSAKKVPREYWSMLLAIPLISIVFIRTVARSGAGLSLKFFLLGLGFMLLETKSITSFALLFGSTVTVVSIVIASILAAILVANLLIHTFSIKTLAPWYVLTFITLAALYFLPLDMFLGLGWWTKLIVSALIIAAPMFLAAIIFGVSFARSGAMGIDLGSNIFGAITGGMFEYASMAYGFNSLYVISFMAYLGAFLLDMKRRGGDGGS